MNNNTQFIFDDSFEAVVEGSGVAVFIRPQFLKVGEVIQGVLDEVRAEVGKYKKPALFLTLTAPLTYADDKTPERTYSPGERIGINLRGNLASGLTRVAAQNGDAIAVRYDGKSEIKSGEYKGNEAHMFSVGKKRRTSTTLPE